MLVYFIGPDDSQTCDTPDGGCEKAVNDNPWTIDTVPQPGSFGCGSRCRHMVQLGEDAPDDIPTYTWSGSLGFDEAVDGEAVAAGEGSAISAAPEGMPEALARAYDAETGLVDLSAEDVAAIIAEEGLAVADVAEYLDGEVLAQVEEIVGRSAEEIPPTEHVNTLLDASAVEELATLLENDADALDHAKQLAQGGFDDHAAAYDLAEALSSATGDDWVVELGDDDKWYVKING